MQCGAPGGRSRSAKAGDASSLIRFILAGPREAGDGELKRRARRLQVQQL
jgi:hypothetical protein